METTVKQRLIAFIDFLGIQPAEFQRNCGLSSGFIYSISKGIGTRALLKIESRYPQLNTRWLITGQGPMTTSAPGVAQNNLNGNNNYLLGGNINCVLGENNGENNIPTLEAEEVERAPIVSATIARAPQVDVLEAVQEKRDELEKAPVGVFNAPVSIWYRVQDESLAPKYEIGDLLALWAYPKGEEDPIPGKLYGINTSTNGLIVRRLFPQEDGGYIARAMNREEFPDYHIKNKNVVQVYKIMLMVRF
mgnify:CR=1 FL=1